MSKEAAIKTIGIILSSYPSASRQEGIENFYKLAVESLSEFPPAILDALANPRSGIVTQSSFVPSIAELRKFCQREMEAQYRRSAQEDRAEARRLYSKISDPVTDPAERERMKKKFRELLADLDPGKRRSDAGVLMTREEYRAKTEADLDLLAQAAASNPPPPLSEELKKKLNLV